MNIRLGLAFAGLVILSLIGCNPSSTKSDAPTRPTSTSTAPELTTPQNPSASVAPTVYKPAYETDEKAGFAEYKRRKALQRQFQDPLVKILKAAGSQKHADVYNFYVKHSRLSLPTANNALAVEFQDGDRKADGSPRDDLFATIILLPEDSKLGMPWDGILRQAKALALFMTDDKTLVLSPEAAGSDEGKALALLHESYHAWELCKLGRKLPNGDAYQFCRGEVEAHEFVNELMAKIHPGFDAMINRVAGKIGGVQQGNTIVATSDRGLFSEIEAGLESALGRAVTNQSERNGYVNDAWYMANFRSIDRKTPKPQRLDAKIAWLKGYLESTGNTQWVRPPKQ